MKNEKGQALLGFVVIVGLVILCWKGAGWLISHWSQIASGYNWIQNHPPINPVHLVVTFVLLLVVCGVGALFSNPYRD